MKNVLKIVLVFFAFYLMIGCGSTKTKSTTTSKVTDKSVKTEALKETTAIETKYFGDTLKGVIPLPVLSEKPVAIFVESGGQKLEFKVTDTSLAYVSTPKHIATITIHSVKETDIKAVADVVQVDKEIAVKTEKPWRPPWWCYLVVFVVLCGVGYYIKTRLNPITSLIQLGTKWKTKIQEILK